MMNNGRIAARMDEAIGPHQEQKKQEVIQETKLIHYLILFYYCLLSFRELYELRQCFTGGSQSLCKFGPNTCRGTANISYPKSLMFCPDRLYSSLIKFREHVRIDHSSTAYSRRFCIPRTTNVTKT